MSYVQAIFPYQFYVGGSIPKVFGCIDDMDDLMKIARYLYAKIRQK